MLEPLQKRKARDNSPDNDGVTALHLACAGGHGSIVQLLIKDSVLARTSPPTMEQRHCTLRVLVAVSLPLHLACAGGHDSTIKLLIKNFGADVKARDRAGRTALYLLLKKLYVSQVLNFNPQHIARVDPIARELSGPRRPDP